MTPKQKAEELLEGMTFSCRECDYEIRAKYCAIRAVDEIIEVACDESDYDKSVTKIYWQEVKNEIEKL